MNFLKEKIYKNIRIVDVIAVILIVILSLIAKVSMFNFKSGDYNIFLQPWYEIMKNVGGFKSLALDIGDYTPAYMYFMALLTYIPIDSLIGIKIFSCLFDIFLAVGVALIAYNFTNNNQKAILAFGIASIAPTIMLNSGMWGQCDVIYTSFIIYSLYCLLKNKPLAATIFFGISISFKIQAIFFFPVLIVLWLKNKYKFRYFFVIPLVYVVSIIPAFIAGRSLWNLLTIYFHQAGQYSSLSLNFPNFYIWIQGDNSHFIATMGIIIAITIILFVLYYVFITDFHINNRLILSFALLFALLIPFILPHMHERYLYLADVISILYAIVYKKRWTIPIVVISSSLLSYIPYLFHNTPINLAFVSIAVFICIYVVATDIIKGINSTKIISKEEAHLN